MNVAQYQDKILEYNTTYPDKAVLLLQAPSILLLNSSATFRCNSGHTRVATLGKILSNKTGCPVCKYVKTQPQRQSQFISRASKIHKLKYQYNDVQYVNAHTKILITCCVHGNFLQSPRSHLNGQGCRKCAIVAVKHHPTAFIQKANLVHNSKYDYSLINEDSYYNIRTLLPIVCPIHGEFNQRGDDHLRGRGCIKCSKKSASHKALNWLEYIQATQNIKIQHAGNGGEYMIPGTRMFADGYCKSNNTIYEFDGDAYHGNPSKYEPNQRCHPFNKSFTASQLWINTQEKHKLITQLGYNLVTIWESDFDSLGLVLAKFDNIITSRIDVEYPQKLLDQGLEIVGEYTGSKEHHMLKCLQCGDTHDATPISKLWVKARYPNTYGCPNCNTQRKHAVQKDSSTYPDRLLALGYKVSGYVNAGTRANITCIKCNTTRLLLPSAVMQHNKPHNCRGSDAS
jgi:hypothetical protein